MSESRGPLIVIGGHEDRTGERVILREVAANLGGRPLLLCAAASRQPERYVELYRDAFADLGVEVLELTPEAPRDAAEGAGGVFFSGGDQVRLAARVRGSGAELIARAVWEAGGVIAGTSAGASVMSETMLARGDAESTPADDEIEFGDGLGLLPGVLIDQHFAERGRIGRLAAAVQARPALLGIGIDEDTAIVVTGGSATVIGAGGVYVLGGRQHGPGFTLLVLSDGDGFDLARTESAA